MNGSNMTIPSTDFAAQIQAIEAELIKLSGTLTDLASTSDHPKQAIAIRRVHANLLQVIISLGDVL